MPTPRYDDPTQDEKNLLAGKSPAFIAAFHKEMERQALAENHVETANAQKAAALHAQKIREAKVQAEAKQDAAEAVARFDKHRRMNGAAQAAADHNAWLLSNAWKRQPAG